MAGGPRLHNGNKQGVVVAVPDHTHHALLVP